MEKNEDVGLFYWKSRIKKMLLLMKLICEKRKRLLKVF